MIFSLVVILSVLALIFTSVHIASSEEAPLAPALAKSHWPIAHASTWNSDYTSNTGPKDGNANVQLLLNGETVTDLISILSTADPITLVQSSVEGYTWGSSISSVFQTKTNTETGELEVVNTFFRDYNFEYHGAYCLLAADGTYYAATRTSIQAYNNEVSFDFSTPIVKKGEYFIEGLEDGEHLVGLTVSHDAFDKAYLMFATSFGQVGGVKLDFSKASNLVRIPGIEGVKMPDHFVSNSIAMDGEAGGVFVCTSYSLARIAWNPSTESLSLDWNTAYGDGQDDWYWGRLGPGCGTSPTIIGPKGKPEYVTINDGLTPMNILFFDAHSGEMVGKHVVAFGSRESNYNSTTDQSIVVKGYKALVVNNWVADTVTPFCSEWFASLNVTDALKHECPFLFGSYVNGVEQFEIDPNTKAVRSTWANSHVSCTSSIPVVSEDDILYCLGKRPKKVGRDVYTIEAMDWQTGKSLFYVELSPSLLANSLYAATEIGTNQDIVMGTLAGLVRVSPATTKKGFEIKSFLQAKGKKSEEANGAVNVYWALDQLAAMNAKGEIPTAEFLEKIHFFH